MRSIGIRTVGMESGNASSGNAGSRNVGYGRSGNQRNAISGNAKSVVMILIEGGWEYCEYENREYGQWEFAKNADIWDTKSGNVHCVNTYK